MARQFGYGGLGNTNGTRSFAGKAEASEPIVYAARVLGYGGIGNTKGTRDFSGKATADITVQGEYQITFRRRRLR